MLLPRIYRSQSLKSTLQRIRFISTLPNNPHIYTHPNPTSPSTHILTFLPTQPPTYALSLGTTTSLPPTPTTFTPNPQFLPLLHSVLAKHATADPAVKSQAAIYASQSSSFSPSSFQLPSNHPARSTEKRTRPPGAGFVSSSSSKTNTTGAGPTATQGGAGSKGRGGFVHISDTRHPPDFGRIADPEDIFGTVEVEGDGEFVKGEGNYQESGTYRIITREGICGLSSFLRERLVERLLALEKKGENL